jgi:hypothetical protein
MLQKTVHGLAIFAALACGAVAAAPDPGEHALEDQVLQDARELLQSGRREMIAYELHLTDAEGAGFWPVYDQYHESVMAVHDRYADTIVDYLETYRSGTVTDTYAAQLIDNVLEVKHDLLRLQKKYLKRFRRVLPIRKVARFYQLENKMDAEIDAQLAVVIPLMDPV